MEIALIVLMILGGSSCVFGALQWEKIEFTGSAPEARRDSSIGWDKTRNRLFIFGGRAGSKIFDDTWMFDMATKKWSEVTPSMLYGKRIPENRFTIIFGTYNDGFYVSTGEGKSSAGARQFYNDAYRLDFATLNWTRLAVGSGEVPRTRYGASGGIHANGHYLFVTHGFAGTRYADTFKLDLKDPRWIKTHGDIHPYEPFKPHARCLQSGVMLTTEKMLMYGGCASGGGTGGPCPAQDNWLYDDSKTEWKELETCASPRIYSALAVLPNATVSGKLVNIAVLYGGGESNDEVIEVTKAPDNEVTIFEESTEEWSRRTVAKDPKNGVPAKRVGPVMTTVSNGIIMFGGTGGKLTNELWLLKGNANDARNSPKPGGCQGRMTNFILVHGVLMFFGWGLFLQLGAFIARYMKGIGSTWFLLHRIFQTLGLALSIAAFGVGIKSVRFDHFEFAHGGIGLAIMILGILQPLNAVIRPHKDESGHRTKGRLIWEIIHKNSGRIALLLAIVNITLGLYLGVAATAVWGVWLAYVCILFVAYVVAEVRLIMKGQEGSASMEMERK